MNANLLRRVTRALAWGSIVLGTVALLGAAVKGDGYAPALAGIAVGLGALAVARSTGATPR